MSTNWADFAEDDDGEMDLQVELPERTETEVDERGIKKVTYYERKDDGQIMKVTQRVKVIELRQKTPLRTIRRRYVCHCQTIVHSANIVFRLRSLSNISANDMPNNLRANLTSFLPL